MHLTPEKTKDADKVAKILRKDYVIRESDIGCRFAVFDITKRKAINALKRAGWKEGGCKIISDGETFISIASRNHKKFFLVRV